MPAFSGQNASKDARVTLGVMAIMKWGVLSVALLLMATVVLAQPPLLKKGSKAVPFSLPTLDGETVSLQLVGGKLTVTQMKVVNDKKVTKTIHPKVVIIDFWATW